MKTRFEELDSLRGLAACSVLIGHLFFSLPIYWKTTSETPILLAILKNSPLHIFLAGHEAVILFFVLSGFVLSLPFLNKNEFSYRDYIIRRVCRIYLPYLVITIVAIIVGSFFIQTNNLIHLSNFYNSFWHKPITWDRFIGDFLLILPLPTGTFNFVTWSLVHEMRISIIFPFIIVFIIKFSWIKNFFTVFGLSLISYIIKSLLINRFGFSPYSMYLNILDTFHYLSMFVLGAILAKNRLFIVDLTKNTNRLFKYSLLFTGILFYTYPFWFFPDMYLFHRTIINDWMTSLGAMIFIVISLSFKGITLILLKRPINFLGKISYSFYLLHPIVLLALPKLINGLMPTWILFCLIFVMTVILSSISYNFIEYPSIELGKRITKFIKKEDLVKRPIKQLYLKK